MKFVELNDWALKAKKVLKDEYTESWGLTLDDTLQFSIEDLYFIHKEYGLNMTKDDRGCLAFTR